MERRCVNCGAAPGPTDTFCGECGAPFATTSYPPMSSQPPGPPYQQTITPPYIAPAYVPTPLRKRGSGATFAIATVVIALLVSLQVYQKMANKTSTMTLTAAAKPANQLADR